MTETVSDDRLAASRADTLLQLETLGLDYDQAIVADGVRACLIRVRDVARERRASITPGREPVLCVVLEAALDDELKNLPLPVPAELKARLSAYGSAVIRSELGIDAEGESDG